MSTALRLHAHALLTGLMTLTGIQKARTGNCPMLVCRGLNIPGGFDSNFNAIDTDSKPAAAMLQIITPM